MQAFKALVALPLLGVIGSAVAAGAQSARPVVTAPADQQADQRDIVVTARRSAEAKVASASEFDEVEIAAEGADTIEDLLARLAPFIGNDRDLPIILINGRPAGFDQSVLAYPPEALTRLAVLKPEAAAVYGAPVGKRVVNLVLKRKFSSLTADVGVDMATGGGQAGTTLSLARTAVAGDTRWNLQARLARDGALLKSARAITRPAGAFDSVGYVSSLDGGDIPALRDAAGRSVTVAGIPRQAGSAAPTIDDFIATANRTAPADPNAATTVLPMRRSIALGGSVSRPVGLFSITLDLNANTSLAQALRGLPMAAIVLPAGSPWSPFATDVLLTRPFAGARALRNDSRATAVGGSLSLTGSTGGWQTSVALSYLHTVSEDVLESGIDTARIQQLVSAGDPRFNPYGAWSTSLLLATRGAARGDTLGARLNLQKAVATLPAGPLAWSLVADASHVTSDSRQSDPTGTTRSVTAFSQINAQMSLAVPVLRRDRSGVAGQSEMNATLWIGGQAMSRTRVQTRAGAGVHWSPIEALQFDAVYEYAGTAPAFEQLDAPIVRTVARVFDYTRQEVAEPTWITGGTLGLARGARRTLSLSALLRPLADQRLLFTLNYRETTASGGSTAFPELTPAVEMAFPERVTRDSAGRLLAVDARAINIVRDSNADLLSGIALRLASAKRGAAAKGRVTLALTHTWHLENTMLIRPGIPVIDRLAGGSGASRHSLNLQFGVAKRGIGANLTANWSSPTRIGAGEALRITPPTVLGLNAFVELARTIWPLRNLTMSLSIENLTNGYSRFTLRDGSTPPGLGRDDVDPLGRTMRLTFRKRF